MGRSWERWAAASGIGFAILLVVGNLIPGEPKKYDASSESIVSYLQDKHTQLLIAGMLYGLAYILFLWFLASFAGTFREAGQPRLSTIIFGAGVATITIGAVADGLFVSLARLAYWGDPKTIQVLYGLAWFVYGRIFWTASALALATVIAVRRSRVFPEWYAWLTLVAAVILVLGAISEKSTGFFSPSGGMPLISLLAIVVWVTLSSVLLVQRTPAAPTSAA